MDKTVAGIGEDAVLRMNPAFVPIEVSPNEIQFRAGPISGPRYTVRDEEGDGTLGDLPGLLDGQQTVDEILGHFARSDRGQVREILSDLLDRDVVLAEEDRKKPVTGVDGYLSLTTLGTDGAGTPEGDRDVLVVAEGNVGPGLATQLADLSIGSVRLINPRLEPSDVARPDVTVSAEGPDRAAIGDADAVVFVADSPAPFLLEELNRVVHAVGTPLLVGQVNHVDGFVGPAIVPGRSPCYNCFRRRLEANLADRHRYQQYRVAPSASTAGSIEPLFARVIAAHLAVHALHLVRTDTCLLTGSVVHFDFLTMNATRNDVLRLPRCHVCGHDETSDPEPQPFLTLDQLEDGGTGG